MRSIPGRPAGRLLVVGASGSSNIGESLHRAAREMELDSMLCDTNEAWRIGTFAQSVVWHLAGQRPLRLRRFASRFVQALQTFRPELIISTGRAPLVPAVFRQIKQLGAKCVNFSTDNPFNTRMPSPWFRRTLKLYDVIYTPRRSNIDELIAFGCRDVRYLPFGYDPDLFYVDQAFAPDADKGDDLFFAGHIEANRRACIAAALKSGLSVALYGEGWKACAETRAIARDHASIATIRRESMVAKVSLCCVRRENRDGHSMRTFELPASGACMVVEDTEEHRAIFGEEGAAVYYFSDPEEMVTKTKLLLSDEPTRRRLRDAAHQLITHGAHTYADRLRAMINR